MGSGSENRKIAALQGWIGCISLAMVVVLAALPTSANGSGGELAKSGLNELNEAIKRIGELLSDKRRTSATFQVRGKLGKFDLGIPYIEWSPTRRLSVNPASRYLKTLVFHAVCGESTRALKHLFAANREVFGGFFGASEAVYLNWIARRNGLDLDFRGAYRAERGPPPDDIRSINHRRRVVAALDAGRPGEALRLITGFAELCRAG